jgi:hypothetical protein
MLRAENIDAISRLSIFRPRLSGNFSYPARCRPGEAELACVREHLSVISMMSQPRADI